jgi:hypothetical protein
MESKMTTAERSPNLAAAQSLGTAAFTRGITIGAPALDRAFMTMTAGRQIGDARTLPELQAWHAGYTVAKLASPVSA